MKVIIGLVLIFSATAFANPLDWHLPYCANCEPKTGLEDALPSHLQEIGEILKQAGDTEGAINLQFQRWGDFSRWLDNQPTKNKISEDFNQRWKDLEEEALALMEVNRELGIAKRKLEICRTKCGAGRKLELEDEVKLIEQMRMNLSTLSPWWISEEFKDLTEKAIEDDTFVCSRAALKKAFLSSVKSFFNDGLEIRQDLAVMRAKIDNTLRNKKSSVPYSSLIANFSSHHGSTLDLLLQRSLVSGKTILCATAAQKNTRDKVIHYSKEGIKYGLSTVSLLAGPEGLVAAAGLRTSLTYLARIGIATARGPALMASFTHTGLTLSNRIETGKRCERNASVLKIEGANLDSIKRWETCLKEKESANVQLLISSISSVTGPSFPKVMQLLKRLQKHP